MEYIGTALLAFIATLISIIAMRPIARLLGLVDRPGGRKQHAGNIPLIGGPSLLIGLAVTFIVLETAVPSWLLG